MIHAGRMGKASDSDGVIDSRTRFYGVEGSRVVMLARSLFYRRDIR